MLAARSSSQPGGCSPDSRKVAGNGSRGQPGAIRPSTCLRMALSSIACRLRARLIAAILCWGKASRIFRLVCSSPDPDGSACLAGRLRCRAAIGGFHTPLERFDEIDDLGASGRFFFLDLHRLLALQLGVDEVADGGGVIVLELA